jgi:hypothetical protein
MMEPIIVRINRYLTKEEYQCILEDIKRKNQNIIVLPPECELLYPAAIRCKVCKFWVRSPLGGTFGLCSKHKDIAIASDETDWCSWAERKEE